MKGSRFFSIMLLLAHGSMVFNASAMLGAKKTNSTSSVSNSSMKSDAPMVVSVDIGKVIADADEFKVTRKTIEDELKGQAAPIEKLQKTIQEKQAKLSDGEKDMKPDAKEKLKKEIDDHSKEHMMHAQGFQMKAQAAEQKFVQAVQDRIKVVAKTLGYDMIVFPGASILVNDKFDKTSELTKKLNDMFKSKSSSSPKSDDNKSKEDKKKSAKK